MELVCELNTVGLSPKFNVQATAFLPKGKPGLDKNEGSHL